MPERLTILFTGRVQGVFFRATAVDVARRFAITGWVRNEPDGSVRCVVEGESEELSRFVAAIVDAKRRNIDDYRTDRSEATDRFDGFTIRQA